MSFGTNTLKRIFFKSKYNKDILSKRLGKNLGLGYTYENEAFEAIQKIKYNTMIPYEQLICLYEQVVYCEKNAVNGAFVECGVWKAGAAGLMALANLQHGKFQRDLYLFDAFDDICEPDAKNDDEFIIKEINNALHKKEATSYTGKLEPLRGIYDVWGGHGTLDEATHLLKNIIKYPESKTHFVKGWFQDTAPIFKDQLETIAILRLDGDWYDSTRICLESFYPLLTKGGICIIDDYGYNTGCAKAVHEYLDSIGEKPLLVKIDVLRYWIKK
jgi:O-methyltransferase